jgi:hypothetical protein
MIEALREFQEQRSIQVFGMHVFPVGSTSQEVPTL